MDVTCFDTIIHQVFSEFLGHALGERGDQRALVGLDALLNLFHEVVNLIGCGAHLDEGIEKSRRTDDLLHDDAFALRQLVVGRRGGDIDRLWRKCLKLFELQRTVVQGSRQAETILHEIRLASPIATVHRSNLRHTHVALVYHHEEILWKEVKETEGACAGSTAIEIAAVVLDA